VGNLQIVPRVLKADMPVLYRVVSRRRSSFDWKCCVAGSAFALGQSAGAGGAGLVVVNRGAQVGGVVMGLGSAGLAWVKAKL
jgi:hypothetical protein